MTQEELILAAKTKALQHKLSPSLVCAICEQESGWNPWAIRMEPRFYEKYTKPMHLTDTEAYSRAISWGLGQVMGETARELGCNYKYLSELCDPWNGLEWTCRVLQNKLLKAAGNVREALLKYNGGSNMSYPDEVLARMTVYEI